MIPLGWRYPQYEGAIAGKVVEPRVREVGLDDLGVAAPRPTHKDRERMGRRLPVSDIGAESTVGSKTRPEDLTVNECGIGGGRCVTPVAQPGCRRPMRTAPSSWVNAVVVSPTEPRWWSGSWGGAVPDLAMVNGLSCLHLVVGRSGGHIRRRGRDTCRIGAPRSSPG